MRMKAEKFTGIWNDAYENARLLRQLAVECELNGEILASETHHKLADMLFDAVELADKVTVSGQHVARVNFF